MNITFIQLLKEAWAEYRKRFFIYTGIIYTFAVIAELLSQVMREHIASVLSQTDLSFYQQVSFSKPLNPLDPFIFLPWLGGLFFTFWALASLFYSFTGMSPKEALESGIKNLHRYSGMVSLGSIATALGVIPLLLFLIIFFNTGGASPVVPALGVHPFQQWPFLLPLIFILSLPIFCLMIFFSNAPFILLLERTGIIASLRLSFKRIKPVFFKTAFFLAGMFVISALIYFGLSKLIFSVKLAVIPQLATIRQESMLRVFAYSIPWVLVSVFFDLFLYLLYLRIKKRSIDNNEQEEGLKKHVFSADGFKNQSGESSGEFKNQKISFLKIKFFSMSGIMRRLYVLFFEFLSREAKFFFRPDTKQKSFLYVLTVTLLIIGVIILPDFTNAGGMGGSKGIIGIVFAVVMVVLAFACYGCTLPYLLGPIATVSGALGATIATVALIVETAAILIPAIGAVMAIASAAFTFVQFANEMSSCAGDYNALFGICTQSQGGTQFFLVNSNAKFLKISISRPPTPEQFAQNPNIMATTTIEWQSDAQPGRVNYVRLYDAQTNLPAGILVSGPAGYVCSSATQSSVFLLPFARKYRAELWFAACWQLCRKRGCPRPLCNDCGWDRPGVTTEFDVPLPPVGVDIKANGSDALGNGSQLIGQPVQLSWTAAYATGECEASGDWSGTYPLFGTATVTPVRGDETYTITCWQPDPKQSPPVQTKFFENQDITTTLFDFSFSTSTFRLEDFGIAYNWCWSGGCFTNSKALPVGETGLIFSAKIADGPGAPGPFCVTYVGDGNAYDYCLHIGSSVWLDKELIVSWQGLTDRYINDQVVFYGTAPEWRSMDPGVRPAKWLTRFTVGPQGIGFGSDSVSISATETAIPPPPPPPPGVTIVFTNPQISLFNVSTSTNAGDPIDVSWQSRDTKFCQLSTYTADLKVNDSDGPITATPNEQLKVNWSTTGFSSQFGWCDFTGLPVGVGIANLPNFVGISGSELVSYDQVVPPQTINLSVQCFDAFSAGTSTSTAPSVTDWVPINIVQSPSISTAFSIGSQAQTTSNVNVRSTPSTFGLILGTQPAGALGTVVGGPVYVSGFWWWQVDYANPPDGWSVENYLQ